MISLHEVRHISELARLKLDDEECDRMRRDLAAMLDYFGQIAAIDTDGIEPTSHVVPLTNVLRADAVSSTPDTERLLSAAPDAAAPFFRVPKFRQG